VRNVADGSVEAVAEGNIQAVTDFAAWCAKGPPKATVLAVDMTEEPAVGLRGFEIMSDAPAPIGRV
jgi:acylphosphatase